MGTIRNIFGRLFHKDAVTLAEALAKGEANAYRGAEARLRDYFDGRIPNWNELTERALIGFMEDMHSKVSNTTVYTVCQILKAAIRKYNAYPRCPRFADILKCWPDKVKKTYLTEDELRHLEDVPTENLREEEVKLMFLIGAYTGCRYSDLKELDLEKVSSERVISYVSQKTKTLASIPISEKVLEWLKTYHLIRSEKDLAVATFNSVLRTLCERANITEQVTIIRKGKEECGPKWRFVSSHTARISFASNLSVKNMPITSIARLMGHNSTKTTEHYCVNSTVELNDEARAFLLGV